MGQMSFVKIIVIVDGQVDVHDEKAVLQLTLDSVDFKRNLFFSEGILDVLNHASDNALYGSKLGVDLTAPAQGEPPLEPPVKDMPSPTPDLVRIVREKFAEVKGCRILELETRRSVLIVAFDKTAPGKQVEFIDAFFKLPEMASISVLAVFEGHVALDGNSTLLWKFFNNLDPKRDFHFAGDRLGVDLSQKMPAEGYRQNWPEEISMSKEIKDRVDSKWNKLFPQDN